MRLHLVALSLSLLCSTLFGMTIDDLQPGKTVSGPELTVDQMHGKVVFIEYWGTR